MRTVTRIVLTLALLPLLLVLSLSGPAHAADFYRYWAFFEVKGDQYVFAKKGVGQIKPDDGATIGFRYAAPSPKKPNLPRVDLTVATFDAVCADTDPAAGQKRVAVIADFGVKADSAGQEMPAEATAECAQVPTDATALQALQAVAEVRSQNSSMGPLLCGIDGYPAEGCADVKTSKATPADSGTVDVALPGADESAAADQAGDTDAAGEDDDGGVSPLCAGIGAILVALLAGGFFLSRRNKAE